jgi:hypothetical protein
VVHGGRGPRRGDPRGIGGEAVFHLKCPHRPKNDFFGTAKVATSHPAAQPSGASGGRSLDHRGGEMDLHPAAPSPPRSADTPMHSTRTHHAAKPRIALPIFTLHHALMSASADVWGGTAEAPS